MAVVNPMLEVKGCCINFPGGGKAMCSVPDMLATDKLRYLQLTSTAA